MCGRFTYRLTWGLPPRSFRARDLADAYGHISEIKVKTRDFR
jgi:hypothetical protein